jgi:serine/threonine-protein kinase PknG
MAASICPNCGQSVNAHDDICENCGIVLVPNIPLPTFTGSVASSTTPHISTSTMTACPNCHAPVKPGEDFCEQCGAVLATVAIPTQAASTGMPLQETCPQCHGPRVAGVKFCNRCGFHFETATSPAASSAMSATNQTSAPTTQLVPGSVLHGKYSIVKAIGSGGMGSVYLAEDEVLKRRVVIKGLLSEDDPELVEQSIKEREFLAAIKHANIVSIYDFLTIGTQGYIVMEYVQGKTLDQIIEEQGRPFAAPDAIQYILGILPAFTYLAKLDLVYCDFKPQNVMLEILKDGTEIVKLIDLGTVIKHTPKPGSVYGTHGFYAREAVKTPSPETDLYSICRTLAYMVTQMDLTDPIFGIPSVEQYRVFREYPALYRFLYKGTHPQPTQRYHNAEELGDQLTGVLRLIMGGKPGVSVGSRLFAASVTTTSGKLGPRAEVNLDENDRAIDQLQYGDRALRNGNYRSAATFYTQAIATNRHSIDAHLRLAEALIEQGEFAAAEDEIAKARRLDSDSWKVTWYNGRLREAQEDFAVATECYRELIANLPGELPPLQALARVSAKQDNDSEAVNLYTSVLKADPGNVDAILGITNSLLNLQQWHEAASVLSGVSEAAAKYVDAQLLLCDLYLNRITPLTSQNIAQASQAVNMLEGRTQDARYYLARGDVYRAAWQLARTNKLSSSVTIAGVANTGSRALGGAAEDSYREYLRREQYPADREIVIRRALEVAPWRLW